MNKTDIINKALIRVGDSPIQGLNGNSTNDILIEAIYDSVILEVLREIQPNSSSKRASLVDTGNVPLFGYEHEYQIPADCIRLVDVVFPDPVNSKNYWKIEGDKLLTNQTSVNIIYIYNPDDIAIVDETTCNAIALKLALNLAYKKTDNAKLVNNILVEYENISKRLAMSLQSMETSEETEFAEDSWLQSRYSGGF